MTESVHEDHSDFVKDSRTTDLGKELMSRGQATTKCAYYITTVHKLLSNRLGQFKSINVRLQSMEKRSQNVINLVR